MEAKELKMLEDALEEIKLFETNEHTHDEAALDINVLVAEFAKFFPDILIDFKDDEKSYANEFTSIILMKIGPEYSKMKKNGKVDEVWRMKFPSKAVEVEVEVENEKRDEKIKINQELFKTLHICSNKNVFNELNVESTDMKVTLEHASLVAMFQLQKLIKFGCMEPRPVYSMTPLCEAIFSKYHIKDVAEQLKMDPCDVTMTMNASCMRNGHVFPTSDINCALACNIFTTRRLTEGIRRSILKRIAKQYYHAKGTRHSVPELRVWMKYATGGLPIELMPENLIKLFESIKMRRE